MKFRIKSLSFDQGEAIPAEYTGEGKDRSPDLQWEGAPAGTKELAILCEDPDAPQAESWVHWVVYKIPASVTKLPEGIPGRERLDLPPSALQGRNSFGRIGYGGPLPPQGHGWHRYYFKLFALDAPLDLGPGASKRELVEAMRDHIIGETSLMGRYQREAERVREAG